MDTTRLIQVEGIVVNSIDYKESSKIIKVFTKELGLISILIRGAKRANSKFQNISSLYCQAIFDIKKSRDEMYYLDQAKVLNLNEGLRRDIKRIYCAQTMLDLINKSILEGQYHKELYSMLSKALNFASRIEDLLILLSMYIIKFISLTGYKPSLQACVICGKKPKDRMGFSKLYGGISCLDHEIPYKIINSRDQAYLGWLLFSRFDDIEICPEKDLKRKLGFLEDLEDLACMALDISPSKAFQGFRKLIN